MSIRWARYANHYAHIPEVFIGGLGAWRGMNFGPSQGAYFRIRRQQSHPYRKGYEQ